MKKYGIPFLFPLAVVLIALLAGCAGKTPYGNEREGFILQYRFPEGKTLVYSGAFGQKMSVERLGSLAELSVQSNARFALTGKKTEVPTIIVGACLESMESTISTSSGVQRFEAKKVVGKPFDVLLKNDGEVIGFAGTDSLGVPLDLDGPGRANLSDFFRYFLGNFFPRLPQGAKKAGDNWILREDMKQTLGEVNVEMKTTSCDTLLGFETIDGFKCFKVAMTLTGTLEGDSMEGRMLIEGDFEGKGTYFFDYSNGRMKKYLYTLYVEATGAVTGMGTISYTIENTMDVNLVK